MALSKFKTILNEYGRRGFAGYNRRLFTPSQIAKVYYSFLYTRTNLPIEVENIMKPMVQKWLVQAFLKDNPSLTEKKVLDIFNNQSKYYNKGKSPEQRHYYYMAEHIINTTTPSSMKRRFLKRFIGPVMSKAGSGGFNFDAWDKYIPIEKSPLLQKKKVDLTISED